MPKFWNHLFDGGDYMPHGHCYLWEPKLVALHVTSDLAIGLAYVAISFTLVYLVYRARRDIPFSWIFVGFGVFIVACAMTHFMEIWTLWVPLYWLSGIVKAVTAAASVAVALVLPPLVPKSLDLIRAAKLSDQRKANLELANELLEDEIGERQRAEDESRSLRASLEERIRTRTAELAAANRVGARMAAIVEHANDAIIGMSLDGQITSWNPAAERTYGYRPEEVLGRSASILAPPSLQDESVELIARLGLGERIKSFETIRVLKSGRKIVVYLTLSPIRGESGALEGASVMVHDRKERKRSEEMLRVTVDAAPNAMIMVDAEGHIVLVNSQTEKMFGYRREELLGKLVEMLIPQEYRHHHPAHRAGFAQEPLARPMGAGRDLFGLRKDGSRFPVEISLNPIRTDHGAWVLSAISDITERKRAAQEIKRLNQDLERRVQERTTELTAVNAELEAFSYSVSHDLRAPLRQIAGFSKILMEEAGPEISPESRHYLRRVQDGAQQMGCLIDDLLNLAKLGRSPVARRLTPINHLVDTVVTELEPDTKDRDIEWRIEALPSLECDPGLLKQVFVNLLSNALKYSRKRPHVVIEVGRTELDHEPVIFVRDNGAGFDMKYADKLFGVFQRLHKPTEFEGTGVGLATVQRIIHKHGGKIWAEAELDKGATFFFTVPNGHPPTPPEGESQ